MRMSAIDPVHGSSTGTWVPWKWVLLRAAEASCFPVPTIPLGFGWAGTVSHAPTR